MEDSCASYEAYLDSFRDSHYSEEFLFAQRFSFVRGRTGSCRLVWNTSLAICCQSSKQVGALANTLFIDPEMLLDDDMDSPNYPDSDYPDF